MLLASKLKFNYLIIGKFSLAISEHLHQILDEDDQLLIINWILLNYNLLN